MFHLKACACEQCKKIKKYQFSIPSGRTLSGITTKETWRYTKDKHGERYERIE